MKTRLNALILLMGLLSLTSCSKKLTYYTQDLSEQYRWSENELKRIQFYVSEDIVLYKSKKGGRSKIEDGKIEIKSNRQTDKIVIKKGTPGTLIFTPKEDRYAVSFDNSGSHLMFGPSKKNYGRFTLLAKEWKDKRNQGIVSYGNAEYTTDSSSAYAALLVDLKKARKSVVKTSTVSGRKVRK